MAIIKTSPFKKGKAKSKPNITTPKISNDSASLADRHRLRKCFDLESIELRMHYETNNPAKPFYSRDFSLLVQRFPHHEELIKQFLMGVAMSIGKRKAAFQSFQSAAHGIEQFVDFRENLSEVFWIRGTLYRLIIWFPHRDTAGHRAWHLDILTDLSLSISS